MVVFSVVTPFCLVIVDRRFRDLTVSILHLTHRPDDGGSKLQTSPMRGLVSVACMAGRWRLHGGFPTLCLWLGIPRLGIHHAEFPTGDSRRKISHWGFLTRNFPVGTFACRDFQVFMWFARYRVRFQPSWNMSANFITPQYQISWRSIQPFFEFLHADRWTDRQTWGCQQAHICNF
jgi:hypothetical protein